MIWTAWNNSVHHRSGAGYGFKIDPVDRDRHFNRAWGKVSIQLPIAGSCVKAVANIDKDSFWNKSCRELINIEIGRWMLDAGYAPWTEGGPPKFEVEPLGAGLFRVKGQV